MQATAATIVRRAVDSGVGFVIVGTPRSGTTLVQRLACELPGIGMPPETHFLGFYALDMLRRRTFPLQGEALRTELETFARLRTSVELELDVDAVYADNDGYFATPLAMFGAIVRSLTGDAALYGEKSPEHLLWWRPLTSASPALKVIMVVRDPRAVVTSMLEAWKPAPQRGVDHHLLRAERWAADQRIVADAAATLGPEQHLVLRYEDVVANPVAAKAALADLLQVANQRDQMRPAAHARIVLPREAWKARTFDAITDERVEAWRETLTEEQRATIAAVCADGMARFGYHDDAPGREGVMHPRTRWLRTRFRFGRYRLQRRIERAVL